MYKFLAMFLLFAPVLNAEYLHLTKPESGTGSILTLESGQAAELHYASFHDGAQLEVQLGGNSYYYLEGEINNSARSIIISGPATLEVIDDGEPATTTYGFISIRVLREGQRTNLSDAVILPATSGTNVDIFLEASDDLVNWIRVTPDIYDPANSPRFYRVRVVPIH